MVITSGLYKWWDKKDPNIGFNIEYQGTYYIFNENEPCKALGLLIEGEIMIASYSFMEREVVFSLL